MGIEGETNEHTRLRRYVQQIDKENGIDEMGRRDRVGIKQYYHYLVCECFPPRNGIAYIFQPWL